MGSIVDGIVEAIENLIGEIFYAVEILFCLILSWLQKLFNVFSGIDDAEYQGQPENLVNIFFNNKTIQNIYWGMAAIGIVLVFVFAIMAVIKKSFDLDDKVKQSYGQIIRNVMRTILVIISMNLIITVSVTFTDYLMDAVNEVFDNADSLVGDDPHIEYTDEQFAAMARIFNTVGNYSLNPSYKNRYNINACFNEIRGDLAYLEETGVFNYYYNDKDDNGNQIDTWQSVLQEIYNSADINQELASDTYNDIVARSLDHYMTVLRSSGSNFQALPSYDKEKISVDQDVPLDRILFLIGTMGMGDTTAAKNPAYDKNPSLFDNLRAPYYSGEKSIYKLSTVESDFNLWILRMNYVVVYFAGMLLIKNMAIIAVNCIVRIFNLLFLYLIAPPIIAASPLDDGGKYRQWLTAFIIQLFSVFATVISMRVFLVYVPIVINPDLKLVPSGTLSGVLDMIGKVVMIWAGTEAVEKANGLLTGILADMAGHQSLLAGDMSSAVKGSAIGQAAAAAKSKFEGAVTSAALTPVKAGLAVAKTAGRVAALPFRPITGAVSNAGKWVEHGLSSAENFMDNSILSSPEQSQKNQQKQQDDYNKAHPNGAEPLKDLKAPEIPMGGLNPGGGNNGNLPDMNNALGNNGNDNPEMPNNAGEAMQDALGLNGGNNNNNNNNNNGDDNNNNLPPMGGGGAFGGGDNNNGGNNNNGGEGNEANMDPNMPDNQGNIAQQQQQPVGNQNNNNQIGAGMGMMQQGQPPQQGMGMQQGQPPQQQGRVNRNPPPQRQNNLRRGNNNQNPNRQGAQPGVGGVPGNVLPGNNANIQGARPANPNNNQPVQNQQRQGGVGNNNRPAGAANNLPNIGGGAVNNNQPQIGNARVQPNQNVNRQVNNPIPQNMNQGINNMQGNYNQPVQNRQVQGNFGNNNRPAGVANNLPNNGNNAINNNQPPVGNARVQPNQNMNRNYSQQAQRLFGVNAQGQPVNQQINNPIPQNMNQGGMGNNNRPVGAANNLPNNGNNVINNNQPPVGNAGVQPNRNVNQQINNPIPQPPPQNQGGNFFGNNH